MERTMSSEELAVYTERITNPSNTFRIFLNDYVTGNPWIRSRGDEDIKVWDNLDGIELETAKQIIIDELNIVLDASYIRAVGIFRDERAIPLLKEIIDLYPQKYIGEKMLAAKVLYDWIGYEEYVPMLEKACHCNDEKVRQYLKYTAKVLYLDGLQKSDKERITELIYG